jgi:DNA-binding transcriptional ArsR family regulator
MAVSGRPFKYLIGWLVAGTPGGPTRAKIIAALKDSPKNANQIATLLGMDYKNVRHHLDVLEKNKLIIAAGENYGVTYFLSSAMEEGYPVFEEITKRNWKK